VLDFKTIKAVTMKIGLFWVVKQCTLVEVHRRCGRTYCFHLQGRNVGQFLIGCFDILLFEFENWGSTFLRNVRELIPDYTASHLRR
jgi:hypothetical protein